MVRDTKYDFDIYLWCLIQTRQINEVIQLFDNGEYKKEQLQTVLLLAITEKQYPLLIWAKSKNADIHDPNVLLHAIQCKNTTCIKTLVEWGVK